MPITTLPPFERIGQWAREDSTPVDDSTRTAGNTISTIYGIPMIHTEPIRNTLTDSQIRNKLSDFRMEYGYEANHIIANPSTMRDIIDVYMTQYRIASPEGSEIKPYGLVGIVNTRCNDGKFVVC